MSRGIVVLVFRCKPADGEAQPSSEATAVNWFAPDEATEHMAEAYAVRLLDALSPNAPHSRTHDGKRLNPIR
ncbi:NUDIX hydrolase [Nocardiopsis oceani]